jgi:CRISPR/Cas system-associated protein Cas5 (RAMP superfamily)
LSSGAPLFALVMTVLNLFLKLPFGYCAFGLMEAHGGSPTLLLQPEMAVGGAVGGVASGEHERIADI